MGVMGLQKNFIVLNSQICKRFWTSLHYKNDFFWYSGYYQASDRIFAFSLPGKEEKIEYWIIGYVFEFHH